MVKIIAEMRKMGRWSSLLFLVMMLVIHQQIM